MEHCSLLPSALDSPEADRLRGASLSYLDLPLLKRNTIITFQETEIIFKWTIFKVFIEFVTIWFLFSV